MTTTPRSSPSAAEVRVSAPSRLHFGLLARGGEAKRWHGGAGLMIASPGLELLAYRDDRWSAEGPLADRALRAAQAIASRLAMPDRSPLGPVRIVIDRAGGEHLGLGAGTQLHLAMARALTCLAGQPQASLAELVRLAGRGRRSGIGAYGFERGGLLVDGGHAHDREQDEATGLAPLLCRLEFPEEWSILIVIPPAIAAGLHGASEREAFAKLEPIADPIVDRLCRLVLLGMLPAVAERDLPNFGSALEELQQRVGETFAEAQGGVYAHPLAEIIVARMRSSGLRGVGQSSWGPALYGFSAAAPEEREAIAARIRDEFGFNETAVFWTAADNQGAISCCRLRHGLETAGESLE